MSDTAVHVESISKRYRIGRKQEAYQTLRETIARAVAMPIRSLVSPIRRSSANERHTWALRDVSFDIQRGEVTGIIGRNGAGKTTLLKVLSRITEPTQGSAEVYGRVGSLLEVGAGFHPELTGRENAYLNGVILGMTKKEIDRKFDEIVHFAEVEKFIDTPVKHYSSGMHMRLAFAVAAHLESEILLVDEVLAVGDVLFQKKCLGKMGNVARQGRTVLFVSHNMGAVRSLCTRGLCLDDGRVIYAGPIADCIENYFRTIGAFRSANGDGKAPLGGNSCFGPLSVGGNSDNSIHSADPFELSTTLRIGENVSGFSINCVLEDMHGRRVFRIREDSKSLSQDRRGLAHFAESSEQNVPVPCSAQDRRGLAHFAESSEQNVPVPFSAPMGFGLIAPGCYEVRVWLPPLWLVPGTYSVYFKVKFWGDYGPAKQVSDKFPLDVDGAHSAADAILRPQARWSMQPLS